MYTRLLIRFIEESSIFSSSSLEYYWNSRCDWRYIRCARTCRQNLCVCGVLLVNDSNLQSRSSRCIQLLIYDVQMNDCSFRHASTHALYSYYTQRNTRTTYISASLFGNITQSVRSDIQLFKAFDEITLNLFQEFTLSSDTHTFAIELFEMLNGRFSWYRVVLAYVIHTLGRYRPVQVQFLYCISIVI